MTLCTSECKVAAGWGAEGAAAREQPNEIRKINGGQGGIIKTDEQR